MTKAYQIRDEEMVSKIFTRDPLRMSAWEFLRIGSWKSAYIPAAISVGKPERIEEAMEQVLTKLKKYIDSDAVKESQTFDWDKWQSDVSWMMNSTGLLKLPGVGYSFASSVLAYLAPSTFPVIDRLTVGAVLGWDIAKQPSKWGRTYVYRAYAETIAMSQHEPWSNFNIHERDVALMNIMKPLENSRELCPISDLYINFSKIEEEQN